MSHILVIDDDDVVRTLIGRVLERAGHSTSLAANGMEGIRRLSEGAFDLVITDLVMPEMEGIETISAIRQTDPALPIIAISGGIRGDKAGPLGDAILLGARATLEKPFRNEQLVALVADVIG